METMRKEHIILIGVMAVALLDVYIFYVKFKG